MEYQFARSKHDPASVAVYARFLSTVYPTTDKLTEQYLNWLYNENPVGKVMGYDAFYNGVIVAHYVTIPVLYTIHGRETRGLLALNTATDNAHRGKGLFTQLAKKTYEDAIQQGYQFVIGVANQNSAPGYLKKLGFSLISPLDVRIGIGAIELSKQAACSLNAVRSREVLSWRLADPSAQYFFKNRYILSSTGKAGITAQLARQQADWPVRSLLRKKNKLFTLWIGIAGVKKERGLFFNLPEKLKPSPLLLIFKDLSGNWPPFTKDDVFFELIDFDAY